MQKKKKEKNIVTPILFEKLFVPRRMWEKFINNLLYLINTKFTFLKRCSKLKIKRERKNENLHEQGLFSYITSKLFTLYKIFVHLSVAND